MDEPLQDPLCSDEQRRGEVRTLANAVDLNGIDFVESHDDVAPPWLDVVFVKATASIPSDLMGKPGRFRIEGGVRVTGIGVTKVEAGSSSERLKVTLDGQGDFSPYRLVIQHAGLDPRLASATFHFRASCPSEIDCRQEPECPPDVVAEPALDYLAKDYASFRQLLLDLIPQRNPGWVERNPADLGIVLVELLAYAGDHLSYFQDAVATEAYLDTCRQRVSAKRHARLIDYCMHDGRNAWTFVQLEVSDQKETVPRETLLLTRIAAPLERETAPPGVSIDFSKLHFGSDPALRNVTVFETTADVAVKSLHNRMRIHTWSDTDCCLPRGATGVALYTVDGPKAVRPALAAGDYLLLEEVRGPSTGLEADADPGYRHVVRLIEVEGLEDSIYQEDLNGGALQKVTATAQKRLPLLAVFWSEGDALPFPLCVSKRPAPDTEPWENLSIVRGNVVPCDHGRTIKEKLDLPVPRGNRAGGVATRLKHGPLTFQALPLGTSRHGLAVAPRDAQPAVELRLRFPPNEKETWTPVPHLLDSTSLDPHFVVDVDAAGRAEIRFGDDEYGRRPAGPNKVVARYRIGNGPAGNLGRETLVHVVKPSGAGSWPTVTQVRQPLPATGGTTPETIEEVRQLAPSAFQGETFRAVTEEDYEAAALKLSAVAAAKATFRWTGSWHTVFVAAHPRNPADLITEPGGRTRLSDDLARKLRAHLTRYKLAGYDLEVLTARYVPLEIAVRICVAPGHFRGDVLEGVRRALGNRIFPRGEVGFFHPSRFAFGQPVYISRIYALVERVEGVESAVVTVFKRYWEVAGDELANGVIPFGEGEIARLDNDPNFPENGVLKVTAVGGL
ncbi:MAG: hypothetical protein QOH06_2183 [Acidobacteriota bacterium]|jgi:hypothetical protein|nr:hypothetical protein [Acidobacteriota bacterium]